MNKTKILYVVSTLRRTGPTNQLFNIIKHLDRNMFKPYILTLSPETEDSKYNNFIDLGVIIKSLQLSRMRMLFNGDKKLKKIVNDVNPDVIHTQGIRADTLVSKYLYTYRHCNTIRNYACYDYSMKYGTFFGKIIANFHLNTIKKIEKPIACSYFVSNLLNVNHKISVETIQNGVDDDVYKPVDREDKEALRKRLNLHNGKVIFIATGDLIPRKDPITMINAFKIANLNRSAQLLLLGEGELKEESMKLVNNDVLMIGRVENVIDYLRASDVFVSSSKAEGLPNAVLEAMSTGLPVLLSDIEPHIELLNKDKETGDIFKIGNVEQLSELFERYMKEDREHKGRKARKIIEENFSAKIMSEKYQSTYKNLLNISLN
ncbi:Glycosyltransferase involved in cell wall bisynthesis [Anaerovirgula multivorans]|uniref:Glycosyltransferase involved in cell wall bisynthesis n=1 Tax=Anaerovirgula multivorans TaxID=312168 RepID=A0A239EHM9_9FIRM|nr:glycosyltransferase family 4 protein [Anaerovirgula multivorans]SNS43533.1 Glycosyltransferase involved in cell wall bisynthesis [Anaerovirgula multivorans]